MKKSDILIALLAVGMCTACTHDGETIVNMGQKVVSPTNTNMPPELRLTYGAASTRAESNIQSTQFLSGERVNVYMRDVNGLDAYPSSLNFTADGNGGLSRTSDNTRYYWPRQLGPLEIFGVYPAGSVSLSTKITAGDFNPFTYTTDYSFTVAADQTDVANYKASDLMIGFPSNPSPNVAPCTLFQDGDEGTVNLNFTHRLTKIIVTLTPATWVAESGSIGQVTADDLAYSGTEDTKYARVTLCGIKRKISFKVYDASSDLGAAEATDDGNSTVVCLGSNNAFIVPPQTINTGTTFIKIELIDKTSGGESVYATFHYDLTTNLTLAAKNVYTYNITLEKPQIVVTVNDITAWTSGGEASTGSAGLVQ